MPANVYTVGPGTLTVGDTDELQDISCQASGATIEWDIDTEDSTNVLCGEVVAGESTYTATLNATILQDITEQGIIAYSWQNKGRQVPFVYRPNNDAKATVTGELVVTPLNLGGDAKTRPTTDIEWGCIGEPELSWPDTVIEP